MLPLGEVELDLPFHWHVRVAVLLLIRILLRRRRRRRTVARGMWVRPIFQSRQELGEFRLVRDIRESLDHVSHFRYLRMSPQVFDLLLEKVTTRLKAKRTYRSLIRPNVTPEQALVVTLRYLATGASQRSLSFSFRLGGSTVHKILVETAIAIWEALHEQYVPVPSNADEWQAVSSDFGTLWQMPNCLGAIDGKHVKVQCPANSGSLYFNYKGWFSVVLLAVCDAHCRFTLIEVGAEGRQSDSGVFSMSEFGQALEEGGLVIPRRPDHGGLPFYFVADEAFPLKTWLMRPFPGQGLPLQKNVFNYRLSRARRTIENAFGIMAARWRIFRQPIAASPDHVVIFTKAAICLHNFLRTRESSVYCPPGFGDTEDGSGNVISGEWRKEGLGQGLLPVGRVGANRYAQSAADVRQELADYFMTPSRELKWQYERVTRTGRQE